MPVQFRTAVSLGRLLLCTIVPFGGHDGVISVLLVESSIFVVGVVGRATTCDWLK